ncbi:keratin, type I cytoskeletal 19 [Aplochiton taeniatus]
MQMQSLNDRLAVYLEKVRILETANRELEEKLRTTPVNKVVAHDFTVFDARLNPLLEQLLNLMIQSRSIALQIDNARLTADDFKLKWEMEVLARQTVEGDIAGLRALQREYNLANQAATQDLQALTDQLTSTKKDHEQELEMRRGSLSGNINVNVQASKCIDLASVMTDIRSEYESVMERNRQQAENWYTKQVEMKQVKVAQETETIVSESNEIKDGRKQALILQTQLEALRQGNLNIEARMAELKGQFQMQLQHLSHHKDQLEAELSSVRQSVVGQGQEYQNLLNIKNRLEMEIRTYKELLEGTDAPGPGAGVGGSVGATVTKMLVTEVKTARSGGGAPVAVVSGGGGGSVTTVKTSSGTSSSSSGGSHEDSHYSHYYWQY